MAGFLQRQIIRAIQAGGPLTVADASAMAGPDFNPRNIRRAFKSLYRKGLVNLTVRPVIAVRPLGPFKKGKKPIGERAVPACEENELGEPRYAFIQPVARPSAPALSPARMANNLSPPSPDPASPNPPARLTAPRVSGPSPGSGSSQTPRPRPRSGPDLRSSQPTTTRSKRSEGRGSKVAD
jgi:hypothetical protein